MAYTKHRAAELYHQYFGVSKETAAIRVKLIFNSEGEEKAQRYFGALEETIKSEANKAFYED